MFIGGSVGWFQLQYMVSSMGGAFWMEVLLPKYLIMVIQAFEVHSCDRWPVRRLDGM